MTIQEELNKVFALWISYCGKEETFKKEQEGNLTFGGYGDFMLFPIDEFNEKKWKKLIQKSLKKEREGKDSLYYVNSEGLPIREEPYARKAVYQDIVYYSYGNDYKLMVEYSKNSQFPEFFRMLEFHNGRKVAYYFLKDNKLSAYEQAELTPQQAANKLANYSDGFLWDTTYFIYKTNGNIEKEICFRNTPGIGLYEEEKLYEYDLKSLKKIIIKGDKHPDRIEYFRKPPNFKIKVFLNDLADLFYKIILKNLSLLELDSPISLLHISYQSVSDYWPYITYAREVDVQYLDEFLEDRNFFYPMLWTERKISLEVSTELDEQFTILANMNDEDYKKKYGEKMWYLAVQKLNNDKEKHPFLSQSFFAYASGDLEHDVLYAVKKSGATASQIKEWKQKGYLD